MPRGVPPTRSGSAPPPPMAPRAFPDAPAVVRLLGAFEQRLRRAGQLGAAREVAEAAGGGGGRGGEGGRRPGVGTLWSSPMALPRPSPLLRAFAHARATAMTRPRGKAAARAVQAVRQESWLAPARSSPLLNASRYLSRTPCVCVFVWHPLQPGASSSPPLTLHCAVLTASAAAPRRQEGS